MFNKLKNGWKEFILTLYIIAVLSSDQVAIFVPSGENAIQETFPVWYFKVYTISLFPRS